jgi:hypothetical protein
MADDHKFDAAAPDLHCAAINHAASLLDGQIDYFSGKGATAPKVGGDLLAMQACRAALAVLRGDEPREGDRAALAACSQQRARTVLAWISTGWRKSGHGFRFQNWTAWIPLSMAITGLRVRNVFGQPDPIAVPPAKPKAKGSTKGQPSRKIGREKAASVGEVRP